MAFTYNQWYTQFGAMFKEKTGYGLDEQEAAYYLMYQDPNTKAMVPAVELVNGKSGSDYSKAIIENIGTGTRFYVMDKEKTAVSPLTLGTDMAPQLSEQIQKPSRLHRFLNTITFGQAYKQEIAAYKEQTEIQQAADRYAPVLSEKLQGFRTQRANENLQAQNAANKSIQNTLEKRANEMKASDKMMDQLLGPNAVTPGHLKQIPFDTPEGQKTAEKIGTLLTGIEGSKYTAAPGIDEKYGKLITLGASLLASSIDGVDISASSPAGLDFDPQENFRKNQRTMLIENTISLNAKDAIRNAGAFQMIANGREYTARAMEEYRNGSAAPVAAAIRQLVETGIENWNSVTDLLSNRTQLNGAIISEAVAFMDENPAVKEAVGLSEEQMNRARAISGVMQICKEGQEAIQQLAADEYVTANEREALVKKAVASTLVCSSWKQEAAAASAGLMQNISDTLTRDGQSLETIMTTQSMALAKRDMLPVENGFAHMGTAGMRSLYEREAEKHPLYQDLMRGDKMMTTLRDMNTLSHPKLQRKEADLEQLASRRIPNVTYQRVSTMSREHEMEASKGKNN